WILRIYVDIRAAGVVVDVERLDPSLSAVSSFEHAALVIRSPGSTEGRDVSRIRIARIDFNSFDALGLVKPQVFPRIARVGRAINSVAKRSCVARIAFTGSDPDDVRIRRRDCDRADRQHDLIVEDGFK